MNAKKSCGSCGNPLQCNDPGGICPRCLIGHAFQGDANNPTTDASGSSYPRAEELVGRFPNLEIMHLVGHGGMGAVYLARQTNLDRMVALKVLSPRLGADPQFTERFTREAKTLAKLSHPNIVTVFDYGLAENINYLVMEYVDGINLRDAIQGGKLSAEESLGIVPQICDALQYAHNQGVIHRDIKPENILLDGQGRVKIADFGLAKLLEPDQNAFALTGTQQVLGTRNYMAPEQIEHPNVVDHRADIYSLGVVFYELLTGELPIGRFAVPSEKAKVSHRLDDVVMRTLEKEPALRFQQASEVRTAVESLGAKQPLSEPLPEPVPPLKTLGALPFSVAVYQGLASACGIANLYADRIELEYEVVDEVLGEIKSAPKHTTVPLSSLLDVRFVKGYFSDKIDFQTDRIEAAKDVPGSLQGKFSLETKRGDLVLAKKFVGQCDRLGHYVASLSPEDRHPAPQPEYKQPVPPRKTNVFGLGDNFSFGDQARLSREEVIEKLKIPRIAFLVIGIIHMVLAIKGILKETIWEKGEPWPLDVAGKFEIEVFLPRLDSLNFTDFKNFLMFAVAWLLLAIASRLRRPRSYTFVFVGLIIVMMSPVHVAYVLTFFMAIWALVVLSDTRCKDVFLAGDLGQTGGYRSDNGFSRSLMIAFSLLVSLVSIVVFASVIIWLGARPEEASGKPDPIVEVQKVSKAAESGLEALVDSGAESEQSAKSEASGSQKSSDDEAEATEMDSESKNDDARQDQDEEAAAKTKADDSGNSDNGP